MPGVCVYRVFRSPIHQRKIVFTSQELPFVSFQHNGCHPTAALMINLHCGGARLFSIIAEKGFENASQAASLR